MNPALRMTHAEYCAFEREAVVKHEYLAGQVFTRRRSTQAYDQELRSLHYRQIPSLQAYLLVAQDRQRLELQVRQADEHWVILEAGPGSGW